MERIGFHTFQNLVHEHWVSAFLFLVTLTTISIILVLRWYIRRRLRTMLETRFSDDHELDLLSAPGTRELESFELIARMRDEVWDLPEGELQLGLEPLNRRALHIVQRIGAVYYPEASQPEYEASLADTLELVKRVSSRLSRLASTIPFKYIGNRRLSDFQRYYQVYLKLNESPVLKLFRNNRHIYKAARLLLNAKNMANPLYWAGKELTREGYFFILRWFYLTFTSEIGKEAVRFYSGKRFQQEEDRDAVLVCYRLFHTMRKWSGPTPGEWAAFVRIVSSHPAMDSDGKVHILSRCSEDKLPKDVEEQKIATKSGVKWYKDGLRKLLEVDAGSSPAKAKLIEKESGKQEAAG